MATAQVHKILPGLEKLAISLDKVNLDPQNAREHGERNLATIKRSLERFGQDQPIVVQKQGMIVRKGNGRVMAAKELGWSHLAAIVVDEDDVEAIARALADNKSSDLATWNEDTLAALFQELSLDPTLDLEITGFDEAEIEAFIKAATASMSGEVSDPGPEAPPEKPVTCRGDLWILGDHRLLCGDSTSEADMARLMEGETAVLLATDPPYLVDYDGTNHPAEHHKRAGRKRTKEGNEVGNKHWDDYVDPETSVEFFARFLEIALKHCTERVPVYQWHATKRQALVEEAWNRNGLLFHQTLIWMKTRGVLTRSHYLWQHEPCFYGWPKGKMPGKGRRPPNDAKTVWEIPGDGWQDGSHPTVKPLEVFSRPMTYHTLPGEVCLEPFSGSGTQIICGELHNRRCFAMELAEPFVDVAIKRWQKACGKEAHLAETGQTFAEIEAERLG